MVKKYVVIFMFLLLANVAFANPRIAFGPFDVFAIFVLVGAIAAEACLVTLLLMFFGMSLKPLFFALFFGNLAIYFVIFLPLLEILLNLWMVEILIVVADGIMIKVISMCEMFQESDFKGLKWKYALLIAMLGNSLSFYLGEVVHGG